MTHAGDEPEPDAAVDPGDDPGKDPGKDPGDDPAVEPNLTTSQEEGVADRGTPTDPEQPTG